jgi:hypothetical protein
MLQLLIIIQKKSYISNNYFWEGINSTLGYATKWENHKLNKKYNNRDLNLYEIGICEIKCKIEPQLNKPMTSGELNFINHMMYIKYINNERCPNYNLKRCNTSSCLNHAFSFIRNNQNQFETIKIIN